MKITRFPFLVFIFFLLGACSGSTQTATAIPASETPKPNPTERPTETPVQFYTDLQFPSWVSDPSAHVLLFVYGSGYDQYEGLALYNADLGERFDFPTDLRFDLFFWLPNGGGIGFLSRSGELHVYDLAGNLTAETNLDQERMNPLDSLLDRERPALVQVSTSDVHSDQFVVLPFWKDISADGKFYIDDFSGQLTIFDIQNRELIGIPSDPKYPNLLDWKWLPTGSRLAVSWVDQESLMGNFATMPMTKLSIFDASTHQEVASYLGVQKGEWSPVANLLLYQEFIEETRFQLFSDNTSPPCYFEVGNGVSRCLDFLLDFHQVADRTSFGFSSVRWSPDGNLISYIFSFVHHERLLGEASTFCTVALDANQPFCILEDLNDPDDRLVAGYQWASNGEFIEIIYSRTGPLSDDAGEPKLGVANAETGEFEFLTWVVDEPLSAWRPLISE
jgi:hypothetical protein